VLLLFAEGKQTGEIAEICGLTVDVVEFHIKKWMFNMGIPYHGDLNIDLSEKCKECGK